MQTVGRPAPGQVYVFFNATATTGDLPVEVSFRDQSIGDPTSWYWQFGDGCSSTDKGPIYQCTFSSFLFASIKKNHIVNNVASPLAVRSMYRLKPIPRPARHLLPFSFLID